MKVQIDKWEAYQAEEARRERARCYRDRYCTCHDCTSTLEIARAHRRALACMIATVHTAETDE